MTPLFEHLITLVVKYSVVSNYTTTTITTALHYL